MKILLLLAILFLLTGCIGMTHKQMLNKKKLCEELGLDWGYERHTDGLWERIICVSKKDE